jgi:hypothetical protein
VRNPPCGLRVYIRAFLLGKEGGSVHSSMDRTSPAYAAHGSRRSNPETREAGSPLVGCTRRRCERPEGHWLYTKRDLKGPLGSIQEHSMATMMWPRLASVHFCHLGAGVHTQPGIQVLLRPIGVPCAVCLKSIPEQSKPLSPAGPLLCRKRVSRGWSTQKTHGFVLRRDGYRKTPTYPIGIQDGVG